MILVETIRDLDKKEETVLVAINVDAISHIRPLMHNGEIDKEFSIIELNDESGTYFYCKYSVKELHQWIMDVKRVRSMPLTESELRRRNSSKNSNLPL